MISVFQPNYIGEQYKQNNTIHIIIIENIDTMDNDYHKNRRKCGR